jgi:hypothetical protein
LSLQCNDVWITWSRRHHIIKKIKISYTRKNAQVDAILMKTGLNNVLLPTLFIAVNNIEQYCYTRFRLNISSGIATLITFVRKLRNVCMVSAPWREMLYLLTSWSQFTVRISDLLLNMLVRCNITAFPSTSTSRWRKSKREHSKLSFQVLIMPNLSTLYLYERRTILCNRGFSNMMLYPLTNRMPLSPQNISKHTIWWFISSC